MGTKAADISDSQVVLDGKDIDIHGTTANAHTSAAQQLHTMSTVARFDAQAEVMRVYFNPAHQQVTHMALHRISVSHP